MFEFIYNIGFWISTIVGSFIGSIVLWISLKLVGGDANFGKAFIFSFIMRVIDVVLPSFNLGYYRFAISWMLWIGLVMTFFNVGIIKAIFVAILQVIISIVFVALSLGALLLGVGFLGK